MKKGIDYIGIGIGAVIFNKEGKTLLIKRGQSARNEKNKWAFPGGSLDFGENFEDCIKREIKEELGIEIEIVSQMGPFNHLIPKEKQHWIALGFICKIKKGTPKILEPHKCEQIGWYTTNEMKKMNLTPPAEYRLQEIINL